MSKAKLRKKLETLPKENVINLIMSLYDASKEAKTYLEFYLTPDSYAEVEKYKKIITAQLQRTDRTHAQCHGLWMGIFGYVVGYI